jgi:lysine 6-dehydrogenase
LEDFMGYKYVVLGAGRQGVAAAYDLAVFGQAEAITLLDLDLAVAKAGAARLNQLLGKNIATAFQVDAGDVRTVEPHLDGATGVISSVHYTFNLEMTKLAIKKKVHMTDFGGNTDVVREQLALDAEASAAGVTVVPDCGMGPGLNISLGTYVMSLVEQPEEVLIWDGGLPQAPQAPWNYVSTFNLGGLTNEYDGNAFFIRDGKVTPVPCFSGYEVLEFPEPLGRLEAFVTSGGLSTSPWTFEGRLKRLENKTLRYPGHVAQFKAFSDLGLLGLDPITAGGTQVVPRDVFHALLAPQICRDEVKDICVMRVKSTGTTKGRHVEAVVELIDRYDEKTGFTAMQRLTGWHGSILMIAAVNNMVRRGAVSVELALPGKTIVNECRRRGFAITEEIKIGV